MYTKTFENILERDLRTAVTNAIIISKTVAFILVLKKYERKSGLYLSYEKFKITTLKKTHQLS